MYFLKDPGKKKVGVRMVNKESIRIKAYIGSVLMIANVNGCEFWSCFFLVRVSGFSKFLGPPL